MAVHALIELELAPGRSRQSLWMAARLARRLAERPGFHGLRIYRSDASDERLLVLVEWAEWEAADAAETQVPVARLLDQVHRECTRWDSRRLESLFHLELPHRRPSTGMAQTLRELQMEQ